MHSCHWTSNRVPCPHHTRSSMPDRSGPQPARRCSLLSAPWSRSNQHGHQTNAVASCVSHHSTWHKLQTRSIPANPSHTATDTPSISGSISTTARRHRTRAHASSSTASQSVAWNAPPVLVVGGGIAGLATALALHKMGIPVLVFESSKDPTRGGEGAAIGLWENAWCALDALGVADGLRRDHVRINRVDLVTSQGRRLRSFSFQETDAGARPARTPASTTPGPGVAADDGVGVGSEFRGVRRSDLLRSLVAALPADVIRSDCEVVGVRSFGGAKGWPAVSLSDGSVVEGSVVVGADGVRSAVAGTEGLNLPAPNYANYAAYRGVATLPGGVNSISLPINTVRQVWGQGVRAGLYPLNDKEVYWFTCFNAAKDAPVPPTKATMQAEALSQVQGWSWGLETAIRATPVDGISRGRIVDRWTRGAFGKGLVTLAGDAAHPMTPNLGQGGCAALEDAVVLARTLSAATTGATGATQAGLEAALRQYEEERSARCLPLTVRAHAMGFLLQLPYEPVLLARDVFVSTVFPPSHFLDHTTYNCGTLEAAAGTQPAVLAR